VHDGATVRRVLRLVSLGMNDCEVSRRTGVPRTTVRSWRLGRVPHMDRRAGCHRCGHPEHHFEALPPSYVYLLGIYLGDGHISQHRRGVCRLTISLDARYQGIVAEARAAMQTVLPANTIHVRDFARGERVSDVSCYSKQWPCLLPQHGPGPKHTRPIVLEGWQRTLVQRHPKLLLRGLIHSDGYRGQNVVHVRGRRYSYPRYQFTNESADIRRIFCEACDIVGIDWRRMNRRTISVARRASVAYLDEFVGPKL
jgi:hypothetical protein